MAERGQEPAGRVRGRSDKPVEQTEPARGRPERSETGPSGAGARRSGAEKVSTAEEGATRVRPRAERYLVAPAPWVSASTVPTGPGDATSGAGQSLIEALQKDPEVRVVRVVRSTRQDPQPSALPRMRQYPLVAVVEMAPDRAMALAARPDVHIDVDHLLLHGEPLPPAWPTDVGTGVLGQNVPITFQVRDERSDPVADAVVHVQGGLYPVTGTTGPDGTVELLVPVDTPDAVRGVYVRPRAGCWSSWLGRPRLSSGEPENVVCHRLDDGAEKPIDNWGHRAIGFDRLPPTYRGHGVRVAVIGSGVDGTHPDLTERLTGGLDVVGHDEKSWDRDLIGRGTHRVALIAGNHMDNGLVGVAPDAEVHVCRVTPGGRLGDLIEALDYCITHEIDVIDLGVCAEQSAGLVVEKIEESRQAGVLCVSAAGDTGGRVLFPANLSSVLTVGAIGRLGTYPPESFHATHVHAMPSADGYFAARFSCPGPEVDLCAPGVAVIAAAGGDGYSAVDSTRAASAYVTALACLVLAHHPDFRYDFRVRGPARVDRLAYLIKASCRQVPGLDPHRCGVGLPDAVAAVGLIPPIVTQALHPQLAALGSAMYAAGIPLPETSLPLAPGIGSGVTAGPETQLDALATAMRAAGLLLPATDR